MAETVSHLRLLQARAPHLLRDATSPWLAMPMFAGPFREAWNGTSFGVEQMET